MTKENEISLDVKILKIAVTGSAGSGKSLVCERFKKLEVAVLDCDKIARQVVEPGKQGFLGVVSLFGADAVLDSGELDRAALRHRIIKNPDLRKKMEKLLHPMILEEMKQQMIDVQKKGFKSVAVEVPLLFESGMDRFFDVTIAVVGNREALAQRVCQRDKVHIEDARKMIDLQMPQEEKMRRADHIVRNDRTSSELFDSVENLYKKIEKEFLTT